MSKTYTEIVEIHTYYGDKLIQKEVDHCEPIDAEMVAPLLSWDWCDVKPARGYRAEIFWRIEDADGEEVYSASTEAEGEPEFVVDRQKLIEIFETIADFEITETKIDGYTAWLEAAADEWDGVSDIEGCDFGGSRSERDRQGYIIDWSAALVEKD